MKQVLVALGSNIDPERNLVRAVHLLARRCRLVAVSRVYETEPVGTADQPQFLNAAALVETSLDPGALKEVLRGIETALGRVRAADKNAARPIDLDIALYGGEVLDLGQRHIPDPDILQFPHLAVPLADLAPALRHPETGETLAGIAGRLHQSGITLRPDVTLPRPEIR